MKGRPTGAMAPRSKSRSLAPSGGEAFAPPPQVPGSPPRNGQQQQQQQQQQRAPVTLVGSGGGRREDQSNSPMAASPMAFTVKLVFVRWT